jgi:copper(I)-binding protein
MLEGLNQVLEVGQTVKVTLRFADAGQVAVPVLVVPLDSVVDGMGNMPGMGGT